jgi:hypothetical protein
MTAPPVTKPELEEEVVIEKKLKEPHWSEGRRVAIRPDVPGRRFSPEESIFLKTADERELGSKAIREVLKRMLSAGEPGWAMSDQAGEQPNGNGRGAAPQEQAGNDD